MLLQHLLIFPYNNQLKMKPTILLITMTVCILYFLLRNSNERNKMNKAEAQKIKAVSVNQSLNIESLKEQIIFRYFSW
jgi:hypothetical protein